jgi:hypothetical protein
MFFAKMLLEEGAWACVPRGFCCFVGFGFEGLGFLLVWSLSYILPMHLGAPYAFQ